MTTQETPNTNSMEYDKRKKNEGLLIFHFRIEYIREKTYCVKEIQN